MMWWQCTSIIGTILDCIKSQIREKLYEELLINDSDKNTDYESITVASSTYFDIDELNTKIDELLVCEDKISKLKEIVPEFKHQLNNK